MAADLIDWLDVYSTSGHVWFVKRLSGNDTLANGTHQAGPYVPKAPFRKLFPELDESTDTNPRVEFNLYIDSHAQHRQATIIWYKGGSRNETRITNLGGVASPLLDPDSTGALAVFAFAVDEQRRARECHVWVCDEETQDDLVEDRVGPVEPGRWIATVPQPELKNRSCWLALEDIPAAWRKSFPSAQDVVDKAVSMQPYEGLQADKRLLRRRRCEYDLFQSLEEVLTLPTVQQGFHSMEDFIRVANSVLQRRKARAGRSLELQVRRILLDEQLKDGVDFSFQAVSEGGHRPDFLFPSVHAYRDLNCRAADLRMLAVKTTARDRWRQVLQEATRIDTKHLLTVQEGVSERQFKQMAEAKVRLVVPAPLIDRYPKAIRPQLQTLESFIGDIRLLARRYRS